MDRDSAVLIADASRGDKRCVRAREKKMITARAEPSSQCASPRHAAFDPRPRTKRSVDPIGIATAAPPRRAAIACMPTIDEDTGHDIDELVDVTHGSPIGITCGEH